MTAGGGRAATLDDGRARAVRRSPLFRLAQAVDVALLVPVVAVMFDPRVYDLTTSPAATAQWTLLWLLLGLVHVVIRVVRARRARLGDPAWPYRLSGRVVGYLVLAATVVMLVSSGLVIAFRPVLLDAAAAVPDPGLRARLVFATNIGAALALPTVFVAWIVLHLSYAERYARNWLGSGADDRPITFPGTPSPTLLEFVYFSFTVGVSVATSDPVIRSDHVRGVVLRHAVLSFVHSTVIVGIVIGLVG